MSGRDRPRGAERLFTRAELGPYDGSVEGRRILVAFEGWVYDVTDSHPWRRGRHWACARAGRDETGRMDRAPHGRDLLRRVPRVGRLVD